MTRPLVERFMEKSGRVDVGCWEWEGTHDRYGFIWNEGGTRLAHRISYELFVGPIPEDLQIDHLCGNTMCVRPDHLEPVTCRENLLRGNTLQAANAAKTHCRHGHPFDEANTRITNAGKRRCIACSREQSRRTNERRRNET